MLAHLKAAVLIKERIFWLVKDAGWHSVASFSVVGSQAEFPVGSFPQSKHIQTRVTVKVCGCLSLCDGLETCVRKDRLQGPHKPKRDAALAKIYVYIILKLRIRIFFC